MQILNFIIMNLTSSAVIKNLCEKHKIRPSKKLGQNFLIDKNILDKIIRAADLSPCGGCPEGTKKTDVVLEVGPGFGALTQELAKQVKKIIAVEIDKRLAEALEETIQEHFLPSDERRNRALPCSSDRSRDRGVLKSRGSQVIIINEDILKYKVKLRNYKVIANLPYQITSAVIRKFLELPESPSLMVLMVQKEVAERICAKPGNMSLLSVSVQFYGKTEIVSKVSKNSFWPVPKVDSAILKIVPHPRIVANPKKFFEVVRLGFSKPRKQLKNNLRLAGDHPKGEKIESSILKKAGLNEKVRAEELSVEDWIKITKYLNGK